MLINDIVSFEQPGPELQRIRSKWVKTGLEKLTNGNRSVSSVNDRLFPVEVTEIADWKSMSEYTLHSNFGKALTGVIGGNLVHIPFYCRFSVS